MKKTILITEGQNVADRFSNSQYKQVIKDIHTETVQNVINNYSVNRVLKTPPPEINREEKLEIIQTLVWLLQRIAGISLQNW